MHQILQVLTVLVRSKPDQIDLKNKACNQIIPHSTLSKDQWYVLGHH